MARREYVDKSKAWRDEFVTPGEFKCACGCELQLSKGDLADAIRVLTPFGGKPRTFGVTYTVWPNAAARIVDTPEPMEGRPCSSCGDIVEIPVYAAKLLDERKCFWPLCGDCRRKREARKDAARDAREADEQHWSDR